MLKVLWPTLRPTLWAIGIWSLMLAVFPLAMIVDDVRGLAPQLMTMAQLEMFSSAYGAGLAVWSVMCGVLVALGIWSPDEQGRHIYALSLPVSRGHYVLLRLALGALALTVLAVFATALTVGLAVWLAPPPPLRAYPWAISLRGYLAALVSFVFISALWVNDPLGRLNRAMTRRLPRWAVVVAWIALWAGGGWLVLLSDTTVGHYARAALVHSWSPVRLVAGNWSLFDG